MNNSSSYRNKKSSRGRRNGKIHRSLGAGDMIVKRMTLPSLALSTNGSGVIPVTNITAAQVQSTPASEWASFAARYQQFRVRSVCIIVDPIWVSSAGPAVTGANGATQLYVGDFIGSSTPGSAAQVLSDERCRIFSTAKPFRFCSTWAINPNARLWNPTSAALPTANSFGITLASSTINALVPDSTDYMMYVVEWIVELRGAQ